MFLKNILPRPRRGVLFFKDGLPYSFSERSVLIESNGHTHQPLHFVLLEKLDVRGGWAFVADCNADGSKISTTTCVALRQLEKNFSVFAN